MYILGQTCSGPVGYGISVIKIGPNKGEKIIQVCPVCKGLLKDVNIYKCISCHLYQKSYISKSDK